MPQFQRVLLSRVTVRIRGNIEFAIKSQGKVATRKTKGFCCWKTEEKKRKRKKGNNQIHQLLEFHVMSAVQGHLRTGF